MVAEETAPRRRSPLDALIRFCLERKLVVGLCAVGLALWGVLVAPFDWPLEHLPRDPVAVDAIPDLGENQQIVFTEWGGRSPQDVEDQVTYPLTVALLGMPGVRTVRSFSFFGFSTIYVIFQEDIEFYWSRSRVLEKLAGLPSGTLPEGVEPSLGPDATALGQVFWYTLEGRDPDGLPIGGWDLDELRSAQDWYLRYALMSADGVSEVASIGGFVREYQIDVDPDAMRAYGVTLAQVFNAVKASNVDVGARTVEVNKVEYAIRGRGFLESLEDIEDTVVVASEHAPIFVHDLAHVSLGPAMRRGVLDKAGAEAVGGVVVVRYGYNPLEAIANVRAAIDEVAPGLPAKPLIDHDRVTRAEVEAFAAGQGFVAYHDESSALDDEAWLAWLDSAERADWPGWVTTSKLTVVPFYDRTGLIHETLGTLETALTEEILVTVLVVLLMLMHLRSSILISALLPLSVLMCFIAMKLFGVDANIVALSGIAIAIGTMVDMGIILTENILRRLGDAPPGANRLEVVHGAASEVGGAVLTAVATTVIGFLPVFAMTGAEGKLFRPLAFTKTFALLASVTVALTVLPAAAHLLFRGGGWAKRVPPLLARASVVLVNLLVAWFVLVLLTDEWLPLGPLRGQVRNIVFVGGLIAGLLLAFWLFRLIYPTLLRWCLGHKLLFLSLPAVVVLLGLSAWLGFERVFGFVPARLGVSTEALHETRFWVGGKAAFPGLGVEFMPALDEGSYLLMPVTMPHASIGEAHEVLALQDRAISAIPEVEHVVGKIGRVDSPLDPAPVSMVETVITYHPEYLLDGRGKRATFRFDSSAGDYERDDRGRLIPDENGRPYRLWREHIHGPDDIWDEIVKAAEVPGSTVAPRLQPIAARLVMLQSGMRAPMGIKVRGPDLETVESFGIALERLLKEVPGVEPSAVVADRIVGKPYLEIDLDRRELARYGLSIRAVQDVIEVAIGGRTVTTTVEGRERYPVRVRYPRELRGDIESLDRILVPTPDGAQVPLEELAEVRYTAGPQAIKSEDTFLVGYVIFDKLDGHGEVDVVEAARLYLEQKRASGELVVPEGVSYEFAGNYENQVRSQKTLAVVLPLALLAIFVILYLQFNSIATSLMVFSGILVAWSGGFLLVWLYGRAGFLDFEVFDTSMSSLFAVNPVNLSVAVWVGFLALFGIASDDGVVIATYLDQSFAERVPTDRAGVREAVIAGARRRIRPALMTSATTILALLPVLTSTGRGSDIMVPMAIPTFGGMLVVTLSVFVVPVLYCAVKELRYRVRATPPRSAHE